MDPKVVKQFIKKMVVKTLIFAFIMLVIVAVGRSITPVVDNNMALTQMQNDDMMFVALNTYNRIKPILTIAYSLVIAWFVYTLGRDTYKFVKNNNKNEKEN